MISQESDILTSSLVLKRLDINSLINAHPIPKAIPKAMKADK